MKSIVSRCFDIMVIERFADYKTDIILSPVHESLATTLNILVSLLPSVDMESSISCLQNFDRNRSLVRPVWSGFIFCTIFHETKVAKITLKMNI